MIRYKVSGLKKRLVESEMAHGFKCYEAKTTCNFTTCKSMKNITEAVS